MGIFVKTLFRGVLHNAHERYEVLCGTLLCNGILQKCAWLCYVATQAVSPNVLCETNCCIEKALCALFVNAHDQ